MNAEETCDSNVPLELPSGSTMEALMEILNSDSNGYEPIETNTALNQSALCDNFEAKFGAERQYEVSSALKESTSINLSFPPSGDYHFKILSPEASKQFGQFITSTPLVSSIASSTRRNFELGVSTIDKNMIFDSRMDTEQAEDSNIVIELSSSSTIEYDIAEALMESSKAKSTKSLVSQATDKFTKESEKNRKKRQLSEDSEDECGKESKIMKLS